MWGPRSHETPGTVRFGMVGLAQDSGPWVKHRLRVPRQRHKKVWHDYSRAHHNMMQDGTHGGGQGPRTYEQWDCRGDTSARGDGGEA